MKTTWAATVPGTFIIESAFMAEFDYEYFANLAVQGVDLLQIYCHVEAPVTRSRMLNRERHACHQDSLRLAEIVDATSRGVYGELDIRETIRVQVHADFDIERLFEQVSTYLRIFPPFSC